MRETPALLTVLANAATSTVMPQTTSIHASGCVYASRVISRSSELGLISIQGEKITMLDDLAQYRKHLGLAALAVQKHLGAPAPKVYLRSRGDLTVPEVYFALGAGHPPCTTRSGAA